MACFAVYAHMEGIRREVTAQHAPDTGMRQYLVTDKLAQMFFRLDANDIVVTANEQQRRERKRAGSGIDLNPINFPQVRRSFSPRPRSSRPAQNHHLPNATSLSQRNLTRSDPRRRLPLWITEEVFMLKCHHSEVKYDGDDAAFLDELVAYPSPPGADPRRRASAASQPSSLPSSTHRPVKKEPRLLATPARSAPAPAAGSANPERPVELGRSSSASSSRPPSAKLEPTSQPPNQPSASRRASQRSPAAAVPPALAAAIPPLAHPPHGHVVVLHI